MIDKDAAYRPTGYAQRVVPRPHHTDTPHRRPTIEAMAIVQRSAAAVADRPVALAERFYEHLFQLAPAVREMFPPDMTAQNERLCRALLEAHAALLDQEHRATGMERALRTLGAEHAHRFGVKPEHYPYVGHALVRAVRDLSGDWSVSTSSAWIWVYDWMSAHMLGEAD